MNDSTETKLDTINAHSPQHAQTSNGSVSPLAAMLSSGQHDVAAIERLWQIQQQWEAAEARKAYYHAMSAVRAELPMVQRSARNPHLKNTYATLDDILGTVSGVLGKHGMSVSWSQSQPDNRVVAKCVITHELGHQESSEFTVPVEAGKGINAAQACGVASTYARRYALTALLGISTSDDADAHVPRAEAPTLALADDDQLQQIADMLAAAEDVLPGTIERWRTARGAKYPAAENVVGRAIPAQHVNHIVAELAAKLKSAKDDVEII